MSSHRATPEEIEQEIAQQREQLADTVTELHRRLDVRTRAGEKLDEVRRQPVVLAGLAVGGVAVVALVVWRVRSRRHP